MARVYDAPIGLMVGIAFFVGVLVVGLVIYTATVERRREYGAVKAIGARNRTLYRVVTTQALIAAAAGALVGVGLAYGRGAALMAWRPQFLVAIEPAAVGVVLASSLLMALLAAAHPGPRHRRPRAGRGLPGMSATWLLARRNLAGNRVRLLVSVGGVALALSLTIALDGDLRRRRQPADDVHRPRRRGRVGQPRPACATCTWWRRWLPASVTDEVRAVDGVAEATPILYSTDTIAAGNERAVAYVIGLPADAAMGGPWNVVEGSDRVGPGEVIVDRGLRQQGRRLDRRSHHRPRR